MIVGKSTFVEFKSGMLLSKEMLEQLEYQTHLNELQYNGYPDGVIYGLNLYEDKGKLFFSTGLVKLTGDYFYIHTPIDIYSLLDKSDDNWEKGTIHSAIILEASTPDLINEGVCMKEIQAKLVDQSTVQDNMLCLAEFQYYKGKRGWDIKNSDLESQLNTTGTIFSLLNVCYSLNGESVFSPYIYDLMKQHLERVDTPSIEDNSLLFMISQNRLISFDTLRQWFRCKKMVVDFHSRSDIIEKFIMGVSIKKNVNNNVAPQPQQSIINDSFGMG